MARHNVVRKIKNRTTIILVMLLISIMVSWVIWGNLSVETTKLTVTSKDLPEAFDKFSIAHISIEISPVLRNLITVIFYY